MKDTPFFKQADLLIQVMPFVNAESCFALKGGTAINFFVRDFPRLSVDIDLVYLPVEDRPTTLRGIDTSLQRIAAKIRAQGQWITLPGCLTTSARRFESEGFHRRYLLMAMMMGFYSLGETSFFLRAPGVYRVQRETGRLLLSPFFALVWRMIREDWGFAGSVRVFWRLGRYLLDNGWQVFFFLDVCMQPLLGANRLPLLAAHDRFIAPCLRFRPLNGLAGLLCFVWFMGVLAPFFWLRETLIAANKGTRTTT